MGLDFVPLGETGLQTSEIQFGTWRFGRETEQGNLEIGEQRAHELLDAYAEHGGRFIDTADVYGGGEYEIALDDQHSAYRFVSAVEPGLHEYVRLYLRDNDLV